MLDKPFIFFLLVFLASCTNRAKNDYQYINEIGNASIVIRLSANGSANAFYSEYINRGLHKPFDSIYANNWNISLINNYCDTIDEYVKIIKSGIKYDKQQMEISLCEKKVEIFQFMKTHSFFDSRSRAKLRDEYLLELPQIIMFKLPNFEGCNKQEIIQKLLMEKLNSACMQYYFSFVWFPDNKNTIETMRR